MPRFMYGSSMLTRGGATCRLISPDPAFGAGAVERHLLGRECLMLDVDSGTVSMLSRVFREAIRKSGDCLHL